LFALQYYVFRLSIFS